MKIDYQDVFLYRGVHYKCVSYPRKEPLDYLWKKRRSTFHVPFYMKFIRCADKYKPNKLKTKFNRNVRPKSTHSGFRFYR